MLRIRTARRPVGFRWWSSSRRCWLSQNICGNFFDVWQPRSDTKTHTRTHKQFISNYVDVNGIKKRNAKKLNHGRGNVFCVTIKSVGMIYAMQHTFIHCKKGNENETLFNAVHISFKQQVEWGRGKAFQAFQAMEEGAASLHSLSRSKSRSTKPNKYTPRASAERSHQIFAIFVARLWPPGV